MLKAARKTNKIMAVGTQQRSSTHFQKAVEIVRSGKLGKVFWVQTWNFENISPVGMGKYPDSEAPSHVDYDRWLGPAPQHAFNPNRFHLLFRWYLRLRRRHDERLGRSPERYRALGLEREGAQVGLHHRRNLHHRRRSRHSRHHAGRLRVPRMYPHLLDAQGERTEIQRPRLRHPLLRHRRQPAARPRRLRGHSRQGRAPVRNQASPRRPPAAQDRSQSRGGRQRASTASPPTCATSSTA